MSCDLLTLADARTFLKPFVDGGSCNTTLIDQRIAEAEQRLWPKADWRLSLRRMRIRVQNQTFCLPVEVEKILHHTIDGIPGILFNQAYEYLNSGLGDVDMRQASSSNKYLQDLGEFPTQFDVPRIITLDDDDDCATGTVNDGFYLLALSTAEKDVGLTVTVRGVDAKSDEIWTDSAPGEGLIIARWAEGVEGNIVGHWDDLPMSAAKFAQVTGVQKPLTSGPVTLYAVDTTTHQMYLISKMPPDVKVPAYRRYRIINQALTGDCSCITALVKIRFRKAVYADDILSIQNMSALKNMVMAIGFENQRLVNESTAYESTAFRLLVEEKTNHDEASGVPVIIDVLASISGGAFNRVYDR